MTYLTMRINLNQTSFQPEILNLTFRRTCFIYPVIILIMSTVLHKIEKKENCS